MTEEEAEALRGLSAKEGDGAPTKTGGEAFEAPVDAFEGAGREPGDAVAAASGQESGGSLRRAKGRVATQQPRALTVNDFAFPGDPYVKNAPPLSDGEIREKMVAADQRMRRTGIQPVSEETRERLRVWRDQTGLTDPECVKAGMQAAPRPPARGKPSLPLAQVERPPTSATYRRAPDANLGAEASREAARQPANKSLVSAVTPFNKAVETAHPGVPGDLHPHAVNIGPAGWNRVGSPTNKNVHYPSTIVRNVAGTHAEGAASAAATAKAQRYGGVLSNHIIADLELTGLNPTMEWNASELAWKKDIGELVEVIHKGGSFEAQLTAARSTTFHRYFKDVGVTQLSATGGAFERETIFERAIRRRIERGESVPEEVLRQYRNGTLSAKLRHGGVAIWSNDKNISPDAARRMIAGHAAEGRIYGSWKFMTKTGSAQESLIALMNGTALTESEIVVSFFEGLTEQLEKTGRINLANQNLWFDVGKLQSLGVTYHKELKAAGLDPFLLVRQHAKGALEGYETERAFLGQLSRFASSDKAFHERYLRYGSHAYKGTGLNVRPGEVIDLAASAAREAAGDQPLTRFMSGWRLEDIKKIFGKHIDLTKVAEEDLAGVSGEMLEQLGAHFGAVDTAVARVITSRFLHAEATSQALERVAGHGLTAKQIQAIGFAKAGLLGQKFLPSANASAFEYAATLSRNGLVDEAVGELGAMFDEWGRDVYPKVLKAIKAGQGLYSGAVRTAAKTPFPKLANQTLRKAMEASRSIPKHPGMVFAAAGAVVVGAAVYDSLFRRNRRIDANLPPVYLPGMQATSRAVPVPWRSPHAGPDLDLRSARSSMGRGSIFSAFRPRTRNRQLPTLYVDVDGTMLEPTLDEEFARRSRQFGREAALEWYESETAHVNNLRRNEPLFDVLKKYRERGHEVVLWTRRGPGQKQQTLENLGERASIFTGHIFADGDKAKALAGKTGVIVDNEARNAVEGLGFVRVPTFRGTPHKNFAPWLERRLAEQGAPLRRPATNLAGHVIEGMGGRISKLVAKVVRSAFGSPWHGPTDDDSTAKRTLKVAGGVAAWWTVENAWGFVLKANNPANPELGTRIVQRAWAVARWAEDALPFKIGRVFGLSANIGSFLIPGKVEVAGELLYRSGMLTSLGRSYARGLSLTEEELIELVRARGKLTFTRATHGVHSIVPYHDVDLGKHGVHRVKLFHGGTTRGRSFAKHGANGVDLHVRNSEARAAREYHDARLDGDVGGFFKRLLNRLWGGETAGAGTLYRRDAFRRSRIRARRRNPYDVDIVQQAYRRSDVPGQIYAVGFEHPVDALLGALHGDGRSAKALARTFGGVFYDWHRNVWDLFRRKIHDVVGRDIGPAATMGAFYRKTGKLGAAVIGGSYAFHAADRALGGALSAPFWHVRDRLDIAHSWVSEKFGPMRFFGVGLGPSWHDIRKRQQRMGTFSSVAWGALPAVGYFTGAYLYRVGGEARRVERHLDHYRRTGNLDRVEEVLERVGDHEGVSYLRRVPGQRRTIHGLSDLGHEHSGLLRTIGTGGKSEIRANAFAGKVVERLTTKNPFRAREWNMHGKIALALFAVSTALFMPFLASRESVQETKDKLSGRTKVAVRSGRGWEFGRTSIQGGKVKYYRLHASVLRRLRPDEKVPGGNRGPIGLLKTLVDPYWRERESYYDRPYPISSTPLEDVPMVGKLLARTVGRFLKPARLMHTREWKKGQPYNEFSQNLEPNPALGGEAPPAPADPLGWRSQIRGAVYRTTEMMGLRGYLLQEHVVRHLWGSEAPFNRSAELEAPHWNSLSQRYWRAQLGGVLGQSELFRRLFPRKSEGVDVNPLQNNMPSWMPGEDYQLADFHHGDVYSKVEWGEARLPGKGFAAIHKELKGVDPEKYPLWARAEILGDVAPWSREYAMTMRKATLEARGDAARTAQLEEIARHADDMKRRKDFDERSFGEKTDTVRGSVSRVFDDGRFTLADYPRHIFKIGGVGFGVDSVATQIASEHGMIKDKAVRAAARQADERQRWMRDNFEGQAVEIKIHRGGLGNPEVEGEVFVGGRSLAKELVADEFAAPEAGRYQAGFFGRVFGRATEFMAHLPQHVPGPFFLNTKLGDAATAVEAYRRDMLYGSTDEGWSKPFKNFVRPYVRSAVAKLTPGDYVPGDVQHRRDVDTLYDRLAYLKAQKTNDVGGMSRTALGVDLGGDLADVSAAMPYRERPYFEAFAKETDPGTRREIMGMVSADMQQALAGQWTANYDAAVGSPHHPQGPRTDLTGQAMRDIEDAGYLVPGKGWAGWNQGVDLKDVQAVQIENEALNMHDFNVWDDRLAALHRKPYLRGAYEHLVSQAPSIDGNILSAALDPLGTGSVSSSQGFSHNGSASVSVSHTNDWRRDEDRSVSLMSRR